MVPDLKWEAIAVVELLSIGADAVRRGQPMAKESVRVIGIGHWDWSLGLVIGIGHWDWSLGLVIGIGHWDWSLGLVTGTGHWGWSHRAGRFPLCQVGWLAAMQHRSHSCNELISGLKQKERLLYAGFRMQDIHSLIEEDAQREV
ncbi:hypothetical protein D2Q93_16005 [Alicyclobacillaceae bacterium I2511]|nr:hypothetical protein D2Q93_16005 [Alicyclobacillaceae bacterium I2511]